MERVRSGLRHEAHSAGRSHTVLRSCGAGLHLELLHRIGKRHGQECILERIVVIRAVQRVIQ